MSRQAGELGAASVKAHGRLAGQFVDQGFCSLCAVKHFVNFVGSQGLRPKDVARMIDRFVETAGGMSVEHRAAEGDVLGRIAVAAQGHVPAGHHEFELLARGTEDGNVLMVAESAGIVFELLIDAGVPLGLDDPLEDGADHGPLILGEEVAVDLGLGDVPVIADMGAKQSPIPLRFAFDIVPIEADRILLLWAERVVKRFDDRLRRRARRRAGRIGSVCQQGRADCRHGGQGAGRLQEFAPRRMVRRVAIGAVTIVIRICIGAGHGSRLRGS